MTVADIRRLSTSDPAFYAQLDDLLAWEQVSDQQVEQTVREILTGIRRRGDAALLEYTNRFDRMQAASVAELEISQARLQQALKAIPSEQREALERAAARVRVYAEHQKMESWSYTEADGTLLGQQVAALERAGLYVPGGKAAYPSSVLMNAIPAKVAGVGELIMVVPTPDGVVNELVLAAAAIARVDRVFAIGGAQAVAALAFGTESVPRVDKIVGPGNIYVATAKGMVFGQVGIDMIAGPSEILVVCDGHTDPDWIAMDLFSQAEHDQDAQSILLSPDADFLDRVAASIDRQLPLMERQDIIRASLGGARCAGAGARPAGGRRGGEPYRAGTPGTVGGESAEDGRTDPPRRRHFHGPLYRRGAGRLLRRAESRVADLAHRALLLAAGCLRFPEAFQPDLLFVGGRRGPRPHRLDAGARRGTDRARAVRP